MNQDGKFAYCPIFDNGCSLLSDTTTDYPLEEDIIDLIPQVQAKTLSTDFLEQLDAVEKLYGQKLHFDFNGQIIETLLREEKFSDRFFGKNPAPSIRRFLRGAVFTTFYCRKEAAVRCTQP